MKSTSSTANEFSRKLPLKSSPATATTATEAATNSVEQQSQFALSTFLANQQQQQQQQQQTQEFVKLKVVIRQLPALLPEETFWNSIPFYNELNIKDKYYVPGSIPDTTSFNTPSNTSNNSTDYLHSRAYILFNDPESLIRFNNSFNGHVFKNKLGVVDIAHISFAINQKFGKDKFDKLQDTLSSCEEFKTFLNQELQQQLPTQPQQQNTSNSSDNNSSKSIYQTPLLKYLKDQKALKSATASTTNASVKSNSNTSSANVNVNSNNSTNQVTLSGAKDKNTKKRRKDNKLNSSAAPQATSSPSAAIVPVQTPTNNDKSKSNRSTTKFNESSSNSSIPIAPKADLLKFSSGPASTTQAGGGGKSKQPLSQPKEQISTNTANTPTHSTRANNPSRSSRGKSNRGRGGTSIAAP